MWLSRWISKGLKWVNSNLSSDPLASNSRLLQTVIVVNVTLIVWMAVAHAGWQISDNVRLVLVTLVTCGAGAYAAKQIAGGGNA